MRVDPQAQSFAKYLLEFGEGKLNLRSTSNHWKVALHEDIIFIPVYNEQYILRLITCNFSDRLTQNNERRNFCSACNSLSYQRYIPGY